MLTRPVHFEKMFVSTADPTGILLVIYLLAMLFIGCLSYRDTDNQDGCIVGRFSLGGLGSFVTALPAGTSDMRGWLL